MTTPIIISIIGLIISAMSVGCAVYFSSKNSRKSDTKEIEQRVAERTETNMKLDEIGRNVTDIKYDISVTKKEVQNLTERVATVEQSAKQAHHRIDELKGKDE